MTQQINLPEALSSVPSFSKQQVHNLANIVRSVVQQYFTSSNQSSSTPPPQTSPPSISPSSTPSAPQEAQKEKDEQLQKQEQQPLYQATVESTTESTTKHPDRKSTISAIPRLCTVRSSGDSAACLSNALLLAYLPDYIKHPKDIEATGQGWWERAGFMAVTNTGTKWRHAPRLQCVSPPFDHEGMIIFVFCGHLLRIPFSGIHIRLSAA